jgi:hypothetical protein
MKPYLLSFFTVCFTIFGSIGFSQSRFSAGPHASMTFMPVRNTDNFGPLYQMGTNSGVFFSYDLSPRLAITAELNYHLKRQFNDRTDTSNLISDLGSTVGQVIDGLQLPEGINLNTYKNQSDRHTMHYIELPVMLNVKASNFKFSVGPFVGVMVAGSTKTETNIDVPLFKIIDLSSQIPFFNQLIGFIYPGYGSPVVTKTSGTSDFNKIDAGIMADVSYQMPNNLNFGLRYQQGFIDYRKNPVGDNRWNSSIQVHVGYRFGQGKPEKGTSQPHSFDWKKNKKD